MLGFSITDLEWETLYIFVKQSYQCSNVKDTPMKHFNMISVITNCRNLRTVTATQKQTLYSIVLLYRTDTKQQCRVTF